jgi:hypothetical protein
MCLVAMGGSQIVASSLPSMAPDLFLNGPSGSRLPQCQRLFAQEGLEGCAFPLRPCPSRLSDIMFTGTEGPLCADRIHR